MLRQRQLLRLIRRCATTVSTLPQVSSCGSRQPFLCLSSNHHGYMTRHLSTTKGLQLKNVSPEFIVSSPLPDIDLHKDMTFFDFISSRCEKYKDRVALEEFVTGKTCTFSELKDLSLKVAAGLHAQGLRKGDVVVVFSFNNIDFTLLMLACSYLGLWFSPANPTFTPEELSRQLNHGGATAVFAADVMSPVLSQALTLGDFSHITHRFVFGEADGFESFHTLLADENELPHMTFDPMEDVLTMPYSSGTTGLPKGVMLTHHNCVANILQAGNSFQVKTTDVALGLLPLYHIYGLIIVQLAVIANGGSIVYLPKFEPEMFLKCIQDKKISLAHLVPPLIVFLAKHPIVSQYDVSSIKRVLCGAAPLGEDISTAFLQRHPNIESLLQGFGMTETSPVTNIDLTQTLGSIGPLVCNTQAKIVDLETGEALGPGEEGEYCVKGPQVMKGYFNNQKATDDMLSPDGWLSTGDIGYYDEEGLVYIKDRLKELIKYKGSQVPPAELEALILGHPDVADVAVIGKPDEEAGELPMAFVVRKQGSEVTEEEIVQENVAPSKRLRGGVKYITEVPKNPSGKILRRLLREQYLSLSQHFDDSYKYQIIKECQSLSIKFLIITILEF